MARAPIGSTPRPRTPEIWRLSRAHARSRYDRPPVCRWPVACPMSRAGSGAKSDVDRSESDEGMCLHGGVVLRGRRLRHDGRDQSKTRRPRKPLRRRDGYDHVIIDKRGSPSMSDTLRLIGVRHVDGQTFGGRSCAAGRQYRNRLRTIHRSKPAKRRACECTRG